MVNARSKLGNRCKDRRVHTRAKMLFILGVRYGSLFRGRLRIRRSRPRFGMCRGAKNGYAKGGCERGDASSYLPRIVEGIQGNKIHVIQSWITQWVLNMSVLGRCRDFKLLMGRSLNTHRYTILLSVLDRSKSFPTILFSC